MIDERARFAWTLLLLLLALYAAVVPGAAIESTTAVAVTFLFGQLLILGRIALRALLYAGEAALYEALEPLLRPAIYPHVRSQLEA